MHILRVDSNVCKCYYFFVLNSCMEAITSPAVHVRTIQSVPKEEFNGKSFW